MKVEVRENPKHIKHSNDFWPTYGLVFNAGGSRIYVWAPAV